MFTNEGVGAGVLATEIVIILALPLVLPFFCKELEL